MHRTARRLCIDAIPALLWLCIGIADGVSSAWACARELSRSVGLYVSASVSQLAVRGTFFLDVDDYNIGLTIASQTRAFQQCLAPAQSHVYTHVCTHVYSYAYTHAYTHVDIFFYTCLCKCLYTDVMSAAWGIEVPVLSADLLGNNQNVSTTVFQRYPAHACAQLIF